VSFWHGSFNSKRKKSLPGLPCGTRWASRCRARRHRAGARSGEDHYRHRGADVSYSDARRMLSASIIVALAVFVGSICGDHHLLTIPAAGIWVRGGNARGAEHYGRGSGNDQLSHTGSVRRQAAATGSRSAFRIAGLGRSFAPNRPGAGGPPGQSVYELARVVAAPVEVYEAPPASAQSVQAQTALGSLVDHTIDAARAFGLAQQHAVALEELPGSCCARASADRGRVIGNRGGGAHTRRIGSAAGLG